MVRTFSAVSVFGKVRFFKNEQDGALMVDVEIVAQSQDITRIQSRLAELTDQPVRRFDHKGLGGEAGWAGLLVPSLPGVLKGIVEFIGVLAPASRVMIKVEGLALLADRGLLPK
jgi:hypothetical protein